MSTGGSLPKASVICAAVLLLGIFVLYHYQSGGCPKLYTVLTGHVAGTAKSNTGDEVTRGDRISESNTGDEVTRGDRISESNTGDEVTRGDRISESNTGDEVTRGDRISESKTRRHSSHRNRLSGSPGKLQRLPRALIIAFSKCGTSTLRSFLTLHPDVVAAPREVRFFNVHFSEGVDWYRRQMPYSSPGQITIEKTPGYIKSIDTLQRIHTFDPDIKLIAIVRNPMTRLQSSYAHRAARHKRYARMGFLKWLSSGAELEKRVKHGSDFVSKIQMVYRVFPEDQLLVLNEEALESDPVTLLNQVYSFLGLNSSISNDVLVFDERKGFYCVNKTHPIFPSLRGLVNKSDGCMRAGKGRKHSEVGGALLQEIVDISRPYVNKLFDVIRTKFNWTYF
ncbi:hypothetical protein EGW08_022849 [Elysia chlorotica]|uniref:Sulfotransferase domain-containing protein n=1 Tax=Elysia chlorotica TaxID=188477 RepID=A0A3S0Z2K8_ELYCH|nr:hypothetical protein EGW08_022849 [Elysia chlorotica]